METIGNLSPFLLSEEDTMIFENDLKTNCLNIDFWGLEKTFKTFRLSNHSDYEDFIEQAKEIFSLFNNPDLGIGFDKVASFNSRCIACSFGTKVNAYQISYFKKENSFKINYTGAFAINLKIKNGKLSEFAFCNGFLNQKEVQEI